MSAVGRVVSTDNELLCMYVVHTVHDVLGPALFRVVLLVCMQVKIGARDAHVGYVCVALIFFTFAFCLLLLKNASKCTVFGTKRNLQPCTFLVQSQLPIVRNYVVTNNQTLH